MFSPLLGLLAFLMAAGTAVAKGTTNLTHHMREARADPLLDYTAVAIVVVLGLHFGDSS